MSLQDRAKAIAKNIEGKIQQTVGDLTGDNKKKVQGKAKQMQAKAIKAVEDLKAQAKKLID